MTPLVSVLVIAYNHSDFIEDTIANIVSQQTNFSFELIISNDASSDDTNEKILSATRKSAKSYYIAIFQSSSELGNVR